MNTLNFISRLEAAPTTQRFVTGSFYTDSRPTTFTTTAHQNTSQQSLIAAQLVFFFFLMMATLTYSSPALADSILTESGLALSTSKRELNDETVSASTDPAIALTDTISAVDSNDTDVPPKTQAPVVFKTSPAPESGFEVSNAPPPGFEDIAGPQTTQIDIVFAKRIVANAMATFELGQIEFIEPEALLKAIPDLKDDPALLQQLSGPLATHSERLCYSEFQTDCGSLEPAIADLIFDENNFRAYLFINPEYLKTRYLDESPFLPRSNSQAATVHAFSASANGQPAGDNLFNLAGTSLFSLRETRVQSLYDIDSVEGLSIESLSLKHDARGWEYEAGAFRTRAQSTAFLTEQNIIGARVSTSLNTRTDLNTAEATPLFVYLSQRSRVDLLRGSQLLDSRFYSAGNQQLDTSRLPDGAYNVIVRIADDHGASQDQIHYFVRTSMLPPIDQPQYFAELGRLTQTRLGVLPSAVDGNWLRVGTARRLKDDFGLEASINYSGQQTLLESGAIWFMPGFQIQGNLLAGDASGFGVRSLWHSDRITFSFDARRVTNKQAVSLNTLEILPGSYTQGSVTASFQLLSGRLLARGRWDSRDDGKDFRSLGVSYLRELRRFDRSSLSLNIDSNFSSNDSMLRVGVDWRWRHKKQDATVRPRLQYSSAKTINGTTGDVQVSPLLSARYNRTLNTNGTSTMRASAFVDQEVERSTAGGRLDIESTKGTADVELQHGFGGEQQGISYSANARFGAVSSGSQMAFGGRRSEASSVIIDIGGNSTEATFEVFVDRQSYGFANAGSRTLISLQPYTTYDIRLESRGSEFVEFDQASRVVTLYPGNVATLNYEATRQIVVIGQVLTEDGVPAANYRFSELDGFASTDDNGWFQIEITDPRSFTLEKTSVSGEYTTCTLHLPSLEPTESLVIVDELICSPQATTPRP